MGFFNDLSKMLSDAGQATIQKGKEVANTAKINFQISDEEKKIGEIYKKIGELYVQLHGEAPEPEFAEYMGEIEESNNIIAKLKDEIKVIKGVKICPNCGCEVKSGFSFCSNCGTKVPDEEADDEHVDAQFTQYCPKCGAPIEDGNKFCTTCGAPVE